MVKQNTTIIYENTVAGTFVRRMNRFTAEVLIDGAPQIVHVKNTGRLQELLMPEAKVTLQKTLNPNRKTAYDLISVYKPKLKWVNIDSLAPNALMKQQLMSLNYELVKPEYTYGESRIDFYMERDGERFLTEVKGCTLADDLHLGTGLFPDAPTERGVKHLHELAKAAKEGYHCSIAFVIQMNGIHRVMPNEAAQPEFKEALVKAAREGVQIVCYSCHVEAEVGMTGEMMWEAYCRTTNTNCNIRHDIWKFCGGGAAADELANLVLAGIKTATASTKLAYELDGENLPEVGTYSVILFDNEEAACIIRDTKVSVVPFNQVSADHAFKEGEDNRSLKKWREVHRRAFTPDYKAVGLDFDEKGDCVLEEFEVVYR